MMLSLPACENSEKNQSNTKLVNPFLASTEINGEKIVFREITVLDRNKNVISLDSTGTITDHIFQRAARPYTWDGSDEKYIYNTNTSFETLSDKTFKIIKTITKSNNQNSGKEISANYDTPILDQEVVDIISSDSSVDGQDLITLLVKLRNVPRYNIPLIPSTGVLSVLEKSLSFSKRTEALLERENTISSLATNLIASVETAGGSIDDISYLTGWITITVPVIFLHKLSNRTDIKKISTIHEIIENGCNTTCHLNTYGLNSGFHHRFILGEARRADFIDADRFIDAGYDAEGFLASDMEIHEYWDELCYLSKTFTCNTTTPYTKLKYKYESCSQSGSCTPVTNFDEANCSDDSHGVMVTSILAGDFRNNQAYFYEYSDQCWASGTNSHCSNWRNNSTGIAPKADLAFFANSSGHDRIAGSILASIGSTYGINADVINITLTQGANPCDPYDSQTDSDAIEIAYDAGAFVTVASGNGDISSSTTCHVQNPGDTPKAFTVASVDTNTTGSANANCLSGTYDDCFQLYNASRRGGALAKTVSGNYSGGLSVIDLIAPGFVSYRSSCDAPGIRGKVYTGYRSVGSSVATPIVSGAALLVKDWFISLGITDIHSPGVLYTVMLAMGDRFSEATGSQNETGGDPWSGFGRLKLRLLTNNDFGPGSFDIERHTFQNNNSQNWDTEIYEYFPFSTPVSSTAQILKCVSHNSESVSSWSQLADTTLELKAYEPKVTYLPPPYPHIPQYYCDYGTNFTGSSNNDLSHDTKHLVAFDSTTTSINVSQFHGKCLKVKLTGKVPRRWVWQWPTGYYRYKSVTTNVFCYYADVSDNQ